MKNKLYSFIRLSVRRARNKRNLALLVSLALLMLASSSFIHAQTGTPPTIAVDAQATFQKGAEPIKVSPALALTGTENLDSATVVINNSISAEDRLGINGEANGTRDNITWVYDQATGILKLTGAAPVSTYQTVLREVTYANVSETPTMVDRTISFSIGSTLFFDGNGHYYEYVEANEISWTDAKAGAEAKTHFGQQGYLATISSPEENQFITDKLQGDGWIGASDAEENTKWKWVTGPESGQLFFTQNTDGTEEDGNICGGEQGQAEEGFYANWNAGGSGTMEPNDAGGCTSENYAHIIGPNSPFGANARGKWNDYAGTTTGQYSSSGYVVEYGGMPGDPVLQLSGEVTVKLTEDIPSEPTCTCTPPTSTGASAPAQDALAGFPPISIYSLDNGSTEDSITGENNTAAGTLHGYGDDPNNQVPTLTEDRFGNPTGALLFDGVDDYIQTNEESNKKPLTFSVWFRADDVSGEHSIVDSDVGGSFGHSLIIGYEGAGSSTGDNDGTLDVQYHNGFWDTGVTIEPGKWYHAFVTYGDEMRLYLGAQGQPMELVAQQAYTTPQAEFDGSNFRFGRHNENDPQRFKGAMDDIRFYDKELTLEEIKEVTECTCPPSEPPALPATPIPLCSWGDVHIRTPDGLVYDFQATGDFALTHSTSGDAMLQARQTNLPNNNRISINTAVALNVAGDKLEFYVKPERGFYLNGVPTDFPTSQLQLSRGGIISPSSGNDFTIVWPDGNTGARVVLVRNNSHIDTGIARLNGSHTYEGVCGNLDGNLQNDMQVRGGNQLSMPATHAQLITFGDSWRVQPNESLFTVATSQADGWITQTTSDVQLVSYNPHATNQTDDADVPLTLLDFDPVKRAEAEQTCQNAGVSEPIALAACTYDVAATGDEAFVESAQTFQTSMEALPPAERASVAAVPSQGLLSNDESLSETPAAPNDDVEEEPATPAAPAEEPGFMDEVRTNPAGLLTNPTVLGVFGVLLVFIFLGVFRRRR